MRITFSATKNALNLAKHGVELTLARQFEWTEILCMPDTRRDYGEVREIGFGVIGERLYCVVFTQRGEAMHVISLRKANSREVRLYVEQS